MNMFIFPKNDRFGWACHIILHKTSWEEEGKVLRSVYPILNINCQAHSGFWALMGPHQLIVQMSVRRIVVGPDQAHIFPV